MASSPGENVLACIDGQICTEKCPLINQFKSSWEKCEDIQKCGTEDGEEAVSSGRWTSRWWRGTHGGSSVAVSASCPRGRSGVKAKHRHNQCETSTHAHTHTHTVSCGSSHAVHTSRVHTNASLQYCTRPAPYPHQTTWANNLGANKSYNYNNRYFLWNAEHFRIQWVDAKPVRAIKMWRQHMSASA